MGAHLEDSKIMKTKHLIPVYVIIAFFIQLSVVHFDNLTVVLVDVGCMTVIALTMIVTGRNR